MRPGHQDRRHRRARPIRRPRPRSPIGLGPTGPRPRPLRPRVHRRNRCGRRSTKVRRRFRWHRMSGRRPIRNPRRAPVPPHSAIP
ncbi:MAG: hypothetical protein FJ297_14820 [Planctomycetes bacterium]|nr:hypothetical protein [Planctomycetota bacterium]